MADNKYNVRPTGPGDVAQYKRFSDEDSNLIESFNINSTFDSQKNVAELHIYTSGNSLLRSISNYTNYKVQLNSGGSNEGSTSIYVDPAQDATSYGYNNGGVKLLYLFFDNLFSESKLGPKLYLKEISNDRTELKLSSTGILNEDLKKYSLAIKDRIEDTSFFSEFRLNFGNNNLYIGINIDYNDEENVVVVKLYEPLPVNVDIKSTLDISEFVSDPISFEVEAEFTPDAPAIPRLREANFNLELEENTATPSQFFNYDELFSYSVDNSNYQVFSLFNEKGAELSIDHSNYEDFIHFSSAEERLINFKYKLDLLGNYSASIQNINTELGSSGVTSDKSHYENLIEGIVNNFDHYERFLYFESGSYSWPKSNNQKPYVNQASSTAEAITWFADQRTAANNYDVSNFNALTNTIPSFIREDDNNAQYTLFVQMIAQHFDNLWIYSKAVSDKYNADNRVNVGVSRDLVEEAIKSLGVKLYNSSDSLQDLFKYFVGEFSKETDEVINQNVQAGNIVTGTKIIKGTEIERIPTVVTTTIGPNTGLEINLQESFARQWLGTTNAVEGSSLGSNYYTADPSYFDENTFGRRFLTAGFDAGTSSNIFRPRIRTITNPENVKRFVQGESYFFTFTFPSRTHPFTSEVIPAGTFGPYRFKYSEKSDYKIEGFNRNPGSGLNQVHIGNGTFGIKAQYNRKDFNNLLNNLRLRTLFFSTVDADGTELRDILWLPSLSSDDIRSFRNQDSSITSGFRNKLNPIVSIKITDGMDVTTTEWEERLIETTDVVETKTLKPFETLPKDLYQKSVYKRIYHNLPFLLKTKGTQRGLRALINCFGIPYNIMKIKTTGGRATSERPFFGTELQSSLESSNVRTDNPDSIISGDTLSQFTSVTKPGDSYNQDLHNIEVGFSPTDNLNALIVNTLGSSFNVDDYIGDPRDLTAESYNGLLAQVKTALADVTEKYDVKDFIRLIRFFDNVIFKMIKDFVPARSTVDTGVVIKPHLLDRSKAKSVVVSLTQPEYSGSISVGEYSGSSGGIFKGSATGSNDINGNPIPVNIEGEYDTAYTTVLTTPDGLKVKSYEGLSDHNSEQAKYDGELQGSNIKLSDGELNKANTLKQIKYPTIKYNIRFLNEPPIEVCFLKDQPLFKWKVKEEDYQNTDTTAGNELIIQSLFGPGSTVEQIFLNNSPDQLKEPDESDSTVFSTRKHFNPPQYEFLFFEARNSLQVESSDDNDTDEFCNGRITVQIIRCAISSKDDVGITIRVSPLETSFNLREKLFNGLHINGEHTILDPAPDNFNKPIADPRKYNFKDRGFSEGQEITFTVIDDHDSDCRASSTVVFTDCELEAADGFPAAAFIPSLTERKFIDVSQGFIKNKDSNDNDTADYFVSIYYNKALTKDQVAKLIEEGIEIVAVPGGGSNYLVPYNLAQGGLDFNNTNFDSGNIVVDEFNDPTAASLGITTQSFIKIKETSNLITRFPLTPDTLRSNLFNTVPADLQDNDQGINPIRQVLFRAISKTVSTCKATKENGVTLAADRPDGGPKGRPGATEYKLIPPPYVKSIHAEKGNTCSTVFEDAGWCVRGDHALYRDCYASTATYYVDHVASSTKDDTTIETYCDPGLEKLVGYKLYRSFSLGDKQKNDEFKNPAAQGTYLYSYSRNSGISVRDSIPCRDAQLFKGLAKIIVDQYGNIDRIDTCD